MRSNWRGIGAELARWVAGEGAPAAPAAPIQAPLKGGLFELAHQPPGQPVRGPSVAGNWRGIGAELERAVFGFGLSWGAENG